MIAAQVISVFIAMMIAAHDGAAVSLFEKYVPSSSENKLMARFHRSNWGLKFLFVAAVFLAFLKLGGFFIFRSAVIAALCGLWVWLVFDPFTNKLRKPSRRWHYLGLNDSDGRFWNGVFGRDAGKWKAAVLIVVIAAANILYYVKW